MGNSDHWPYKFTDDGDPILAHIWAGERGDHACNAKYKVNGEVMGYCSRVVFTYDKHIWFKLIPAGTHPGKHRIEW